MNVWQPFIVAGLVSLATTPVVIWFFKKRGWVDDPKKHLQEKVVHSYPVPRGGGIPIFVGLLTVFMFLKPDKYLVAIFIGLAITLVVGLADDIFEEKISPLFRLVFSNLLAGTVVVGAGIGIAFINNPLGGIIRLDQPQFCFWLLGETRCIWIIADLLALFWITWSMNFVGWSGGVEGQLPGTVVVAALTIGALGLSFSADITQWPVTVLAMALAGTYLGFLFWNFYPQKIMPGYSGKTIAGFTLAVLSILSTSKVATLILVLGIPFIDAIYVVIKRIAQGRSPLQGGKREHFHHRLMAQGWGKRRIAIFYWGVSACLGILALNLNSEQKLYTMVGLVLVFCGALIWLNLLSTYLKQRDRDNG